MSMRSIHWSAFSAPSVGLALVYFGVRLAVGERRIDRGNANSTDDRRLRKRADGILFPHPAAYAARATQLAILLRRIFAIAASCCETDRLSCFWS